MPQIGPLELVIILVIALVVIGPGKLPDVGSALGKSIREFRKASTDVQEAVRVDTSPLPQSPQAAGPVQPAPVAAAPVQPAPVAPAPVATAPVASAAVPAAPVQVTSTEPTVEAKS